MSTRRAVRIHPDDAESLGRLRLQPGIEVSERADALWLHILPSSDELDAQLRMLPGTLFTVRLDEQLIPFGKLVPSGYLPEGPWVELSQWMRVTAPTAGFSGQLKGTVELHFIHGGPVRDANLIETDIGTWCEYAATAPQIRIEQLSFAMNGDRRVLVRGTPLPPIAGVRYVEDSEIAIMAGWCCAPPIAAEVLAEVLELEANDLALMHIDGQWNRIPCDSFVRATRSAVRLSAEDVAHD